MVKKKEGTLEIFSDGKYYVIYNDEVIDTGYIHYQIDKDVEDIDWYMENGYVKKIKG